MQRGIPVLNCHWRRNLKGITSEVGTATPYLYAGAQTGMDLTSRRASSSQPNPIPRSTFASSTLPVRLRCKHRTTSPSAQFSFANSGYCRCTCKNFCMAFSPPGKAGFWKAEVVGALLARRCSCALTVKSKEQQNSARINFFMMGNLSGDDVRCWTKLFPIPLLILCFLKKTGGFQNRGAFASQGLKLRKQKEAVYWWRCRYSVGVIPVVSLNALLNGAKEL